MLVLGRKVGEEVVIDDEIIIRVRAVNKDGVNLFINKLDGHVITLNNKIYQNFSVTLSIGESVTLNKNIIIKLTNIRRKNAWLGFNAPKSIIINRKENNG